MRKRYLRVLSLILVLAMLLGGCADGNVRGENTESNIAQQEQTEPQQEHTEPQNTEDQAQEENIPLKDMTFSQMVYNRPDMENLEEVLQESC